MNKINLEWNKITPSPNQPPLVQSQWQMSLTEGTPVLLQQLGTRAQHPLLWHSTIPQPGTHQGLGMSRNSFGMSQLCPWNTDLPGGHSTRGFLTGALLLAKNKRTFNGRLRKPLLVKWVYYFLSSA